MRRYHLSYVQVYSLQVGTLDEVDPKQTPESLLQWIDFILFSELSTD